MFIGIVIYNLKEAKSILLCKFDREFLFKFRFFDIADWIMLHVSLLDTPTKEYQ
jgi:hypothetical protein